MNSVELFSGAGGMALGLACAGLRHLALVELDQHAYRTLLLNSRKGILPVNAGSLHNHDIQTFEYGNLGEDVDFLAAGVPCQPFSTGGKHLGLSDARNMFPEVARALRILRPRIFLVENVRGLARSTFQRYYSYIQLTLSYPEIELGPDGDWAQHFSRLERHHLHGKTRGLSYRVLSRILNAADYGVPQKRERVFIVGCRSDVTFEWNFPKPTHSHAALLASQFVYGEYWERHKVPKGRRLSFRPRWSAALDASTDGDLLPWKTVRDCISDLGLPVRHDDKQLSHFRVSGARHYKGHTGSDLDEPAKTIKAGYHGVPGGENMLRYRNGRLRYLTVRECARLQTFPDSYVFHGSWGTAMKQIGNAVPPQLVTILAKDILSKLELGPSTHA